MSPSSNRFQQLQATSILQAFQMLPRLSLAADSSSDLLSAILLVRQKDVSHRVIRSYGI
jgi:hypothetical protein